MHSAAVISSLPAVVASQQQYTSRKADTKVEATDFKPSRSLQSTISGDFLTVNKANYNLEDEVPSTPGLYWESDASSDASISPGVQSVFDESWDDSCDSSSSVSSTSSVYLEDDGAQVITIPADSSFYQPPPAPRPFEFLPFSDPKFPENFLASDNTDDEVFQAWISEVSEKTEERAVRPVLSMNTIVVVDPESLMESDDDAISPQTGWYSSRRSPLDNPLPWALEDKLLSPFPRDVSRPMSRTL